MDGSGQYRQTAMSSFAYYQVDMQNNILSRSKWMLYYINMRTQLYLKVKEYKNNQKVPKNTILAVLNHINLPSKGIKLPEEQENELLKFWALSSALKLQYFIRAIYKMRSNATLTLQKRMKFHKDKAYNR